VKRFLPLLALAILAIPLALVWLTDRAKEGAQLLPADTSTLAAKDASSSETATPLERSPPRETAASVLSTTVEPLRSSNPESSSVHITSTESPHGLARLAGRVIVAAGHSPEGLLITLVNDQGSRRAPLRLGASGEFSFDDLRAGRIWLEAGGLDDVVWQAPKQEFVLRSGEKLEFEWNLVDHCPAIADLVLIIDGLPCRGSIQPLLLDVKIGPLLATGPDGSACWRDNEGGAASFYVRNYGPMEQAPPVARIGKTPVLCEMVRGRRARVEVRVQTSLVRVLPPGDGSVPTPLDAMDWYAAVHVDVGGGLQQTLHEVPLSSTRSPLGSFRAGPGRYELMTIAKEGAYGADLVVTAAGMTVDCPLLRR
jgi:hypothetical protein